MQPKTDGRAAHQSQRRREATAGPKLSCRSLPVAAEATIPSARSAEPSRVRGPDAAVPR